MKKIKHLLSLAALSLASFNTFANEKLSDDEIKAQMGCTVVAAGAVFNDFNITHDQAHGRIGLIGKISDNITLTIWKVEENKDFRVYVDSDDGSVNMVSHGAANSNNQFSFDVNVQYSEFGNINILCLPQ